MAETSGLPTTAEDQEAVAKYGTKGNISVGGLKGVSLEGPQSTDIRQRLAQLIAERENYGTSWKGIGELAAVGVSSPGEFSRNYADYMNRERQREQDLFGMHVQQAQLASEEARLQREAAEQQRVAQMFGMGPQAPAPAGGGVYPTQGAEALTGTASSTGGLGLAAPTQQGPGTEGQPAGGLSAVRPQTAFAAPPSQMGNLISSLTPEERMSLYGLGRDVKTRPDMYKELLKRAAPTETERLAASAGLIPGTPEHAAFMRLKIASPGAFVPHDVRSPQGTMQQTPMEVISGGLRPAAPAASVSAPAASVSAPAASVSAPPPAAARAPAPTGFAPGSAEDLKARQRAIEVQQDIEKEAAIESSKKIEVPEQKMLGDAVRAAPGNLILSGALMKDIKENPELFGKLMRPDLFSAFANLVASGVQFGQLGAVNVPAVGSFIQQLSPEARKDPSKLEAWNRVLGNMAKINLNFARVAYEGQGAVSNFERELIGSAVGDPSRDSAKNLAIKAKVLEIESRNAIEQNKLWEQSKKSMSWAQFKDSPQYKELQRAQFYRTAKVLKLDDAKWPGDD